MGERLYAKRKFICKGGNRGGSHCMASRANNDKVEELYLYVQYSIFHVLSIASWLFGCCEPPAGIGSRMSHAKNRPCISLYDIGGDPFRSHWSE